MNIISLLLVIAVVFSLASCKDDSANPQEQTAASTRAQTKNTTAQAVEIAEVPTDTAELTEMLNSALDYVDLYCYRYTKAVKCDVSDVSVGALSSASNSYDAFKSIFGETDAKTDYDYNTSKELFEQNFVVGDFKTDDLSEITAEQKGGNIILTAAFPDEVNPGEDGLLSNLSNCYVGAESVKQSLTQFSSSASHINVSASNIQLVATVNAKDSSLEKLTVSYTERFSLSGVTLVKLEGSGVSGTSKTTVTYTEIG